MAFRRKKQGVYEGPLARFPVPGVPGAWAFYPTKQDKTRKGILRRVVRENENPSFRQPLKWVDDAPDVKEDCSGHWEWA